MLINNNIIREDDLEEICETFFSNPWNRLVMNMLAVHDGDMTVKEALSLSRSTKGDKGN